MTYDFIKNQRRHDVSVYRNGKIEISANVAHSLDLHDGDAINIRLSGDEYYLFVYKRQASPGFKARVKQTKSGSSFYRASCKELAHRVLSIMEEPLFCHLRCGETVSLEDRPGEKAVTLILRPYNL